MYVGGQALQWAVDVSYSISNVQVVVDPQIKVENGEKILKERFRVDFSQSVFIINGAHQIWFWMSRSDWQLIALDEQKPGLHQIQSVSQELIDLIKRASVWVPADIDSVARFPSNLQFFRQKHCISKIIFCGNASSKLSISTKNDWNEKINTLFHISLK